MSIRRFARLSQSQSTGLQTENWTTQATETYNPALPANAPSSWGSDAEKLNLDRDFDATGSTKLHLGLLAVFDISPDFFWGAQVKLQVTYGVTDDPQLEMWTHDPTNGWVKRRKVDVPTLARSGEGTVFDLTLSVPLAGVDEVWVTLVPTSTETNNWVASHLYGDCNATIVIPDCPLFSDPPDCSLGAPPTSPSPPSWTPDLAPIPPEPPVPTPTAFPLPPLIIPIGMPTTYQHTNLGWFHVCPGPTKIRMYFSLRHGSSIRVSVLESAVRFVQGVTQTISGSGFLDWTVSHGFTLAATQAARGDKFLPPVQLVTDIKFEFTPLLNFSTLDFFDWESFLWTYDLLYQEVC